MTDGSKANKTGSGLEKLIESALLDQEYMMVGNADSDLFMQKKKEGKKYFGRQIPVGSNIYGGTRKVDFLVMNCKHFPKGLIIEAKWQQAGGSVDEKYPYLVKNIELTEIETIVVLNGDGYREKAKEWLQSQVETEKFLCGVFTLSEFLKQVNNGFLA